MGNILEMKYLVWKEDAKKEVSFGVTRTWKYHMDIVPNLRGKGRAVSGGYFRHDPDAKTLLLYGESSGFNVCPCEDDRVLVITYLNEAGDISDEDVLHYMSIASIPLASITPDTFVHDATGQPIGKVTAVSIGGELSIIRFDDDGESKPVSCTVPHSEAQGYFV